MKKSLRKLALNKSAVSNLSETIKGGKGSILPPNTTTTDATKLTLCYHCPQEPIDTLF